MKKGITKRRMTAQKVKGINLFKRMLIKNNVNLNRSDSPVTEVAKDGE